MQVHLAELLQLAHATAIAVCVYFAYADWFSEVNAPPFFLK